jgi:hypothetical protein
MKRLILAFVLLVTQAIAAYTEFYCDTATGANINAGDNAATVTTTTNGSYSRGTGAGGTDVFLATGGTPFSTAVAGDFVSVYADAATVATFTGRITAVNSGGLSIDISLTAVAGTRPATAATGNSATIGGKWKGPNAGVSFPFNYITNTLTNSSGDYPRVNIKNGTTYSITSVLTHSLAGPVTFEGYTSAVGDGGKAVIDGGGTSAGIVSASGANGVYINLICANSGGTAVGFGVSGAEIVLMGVVIHNTTRSGFLNNGGSATLVECEAYTCNTDNNSGSGPFMSSGQTEFIRCISHDNTGSNDPGFRIAASSNLIGCIADSNGAQGFNLSATTRVNMIGCDAYGNTSDGVDMTGASATSVYMENCNMILNGGYGINSSGSTVRNGLIVNCGFGSGTAANTSGDIATAASALRVIGKVTYASNAIPYNAPTTGDFRITLAAAKAAGRGTFTETQASYTGTVGYPTIGAAQPSANVSAQTSYGYTK